MSDLDLAGYRINEGFFSPHHFGIPQIRQRIFIVGSRSGFPSLPKPLDDKDKDEKDIHEILDTPTSETRKLSEHEIERLQVWQNFLELFPNDVELPSVPIWSREFGATYPFKDTTPYAIGVDKLRELDYRGNYGVRLRDLDDDEVWENLPAYAKRKQSVFPKWKIQFIEQNRTFYKKHKTKLINGVLRFWNFLGAIRNLNGIVKEKNGIFGNSSSNSEVPECGSEDLKQSLLSQQEAQRCQLSAGKDGT